MAGAVLVTGAAGFAGSHLLDLLGTDEIELVAWHRPGGRPPTPRPGARWMAVDLLDRQAVADAVQRVRPAVIYHCAGAAHVGRSWENTESTFAINVRGTHHLLAALQSHAVRARVLVPSSALIYRPANEPLNEDHELAPASPYGLSKLAQEMLAAHAATHLIDVRIVRPFNHMGPRQDPWFAASGFAKRIADIEAGEGVSEISVGNLEAQRDLVDVRDTVRAYRLVVEGGVAGRPYNVCSGRAIAIRDLLEMLLARARVPIRVLVDPAKLRPNDVPLLLGDPRRIRAELGWTPTVPLERTLDDLLEYWRRAIVAPRRN
jgi:GDP-4-dehydro-6-deoxy-D-mannose reductase